MSRTLAELTEKLARVSDVYAARNAVRRDADWHALKIMEEAGEVVAEFLRLSGRKPQKGQPEEVVRRHLEDEAADLMAHVLLFARQNELDIEGALARKWLARLNGSPNRQGR